METLTDFIFLCSKITADDDCSHEIKRHLLLGIKAMTNLNSILKSRGITLSTNVHIVKAMFFPVWMWESGHKKCWAQKNWCFWNMVLERTLENSWDLKEIKPVNPKGNLLWVFTRRTDAEAETPILQPPDVKSRLTGKDLTVGKIESKSEEGIHRAWTPS